VSGEHFEELTDTLSQKEKNSGKNRPRHLIDQQSRSGIDICLSRLRHRALQREEPSQTKNAIQSLASSLQNHERMNLIPGVN
jgi:hypothetical protein